MPDVTLERLNPPMTPEAALMEANRCLLCEDPPCEQDCPASVPVREFIRKLRHGDIEGAAAAIQRRNVLGGVCGVVCETSIQCQSHCTAAKLGRPIDIGGLQRFIMETVADRKPFALPFHKKPQTGKKVAVVGGGPAGLSAAAELARLGHEVTIFEELDRLGGMARYGIPSFRLPKDLLDREIEAVVAMGVQVRKGQKVDLSEVRRNHDALFLATGQSKTQGLGVPGEELEGVHQGLSVLRWLERPEEAHPLKGKVIVVGGGNTSMDVALAALALGASDVTVLYRRSQSQMPAWPSERHKATEHGVALRTLITPVAILGERKVEGVRCQPMVLAEPDLTGRPRPVPAPGGTFELEADHVLVAVGQRGDDDVVSKVGLDLKRSGDLDVNGFGGTSQSRVYAGGDLASGDKTVVAAVAGGRRSAWAIHQSLVQQVPEDPDWTEALPQDVDLSVEFCGRRFVNPFVLAAAPPSDDLEMVRRAFRAGWAGAVLKTTSVEGTAVDLKYPMMAAVDMAARKVMGLGNIDLISEHHIDEIERRVRALKDEFPDRMVIPSMMGASKEEWQELAGRLSEAGADLIECSFSCPQGSLGARPGAMLGQDADLSGKVARWVKEAAGETPVVIKLTPQVTDIVEVATAVKEAGVDAICASNTIPSLMGLDPDTLEPRPTVGGKSSYSGLSGPAIKPITLRTIAEIARQVRIPITGTGGPMTPFDAVELMGVGATTVQFCTAVMTYGYRIIEDLVEGLSWYLHHHDLTRPAQLVGAALPKIATHDELQQAGKVVCHIRQESCIGCGRCYLACRDGGHQAISFHVEEDGRRVEVDPERCVGCAFCTQVCPVQGCMYMGVD
ncbi:MAG: NAD-dependent dihydropyrimidine dehydrogenase subunit PreA [Deltaproteobacteria bacterium]|nr:NAD-dependent dihydropyrimidine dehydrogenase subunit PreA [Deltaproteobacteria bacterium]